MQLSDILDIVAELSIALRNDKFSLSDIEIIRNALKDSDAQLCEMAEALSKGFGVGGDY